MNTFIHRGFAYRGLLILAWLYSSATLAQSPAPEPASPSHEVSAVMLSDQQIRNLGIETIAVERGVANARAIYPAQVVLPPDQEYRISAPGDSQVQQVLVMENQAVKRGDPLLLISSQTFGERSLALVESHSRWNLARQNVQRDQELLAEGIISSRRVDEAKAAENDARAAFAQARSALIAAGLDESAITELTRQGKASNTLTVRAPVAGVVVELQAKPGWRSLEGAPLLRLVKREKLWVDVQIPAHQAGFWPVDTPFHLADGTEARLLNLSPTTSNAQTRVLRGLINNPPMHLLAGSYQQAQLPLNQGDAWDLPLSAIARRGAQAYVFVRTDSGFIALPIEVLASGGQRALVKGALQEKQEIAATSVVALKAAWLMGLDSEPDLAKSAADNSHPTAIVETR